MKIKPKDEVEFQTKFGQAIGTVYRISQDCLRAKVRLYVSNTCFFEWIKPIKELRKVDAVTK